MAMCPHGEKANRCEVCCSVECELGTCMNCDEYTAIVAETGYCLRCANDVAQTHDRDSVRA